ncbi:T9SS type A sorting domain-containing protein [Tenacibaculum sp. SG-28]|uniref:T9SS type A sorting domain-containing protein n=1 Tax=Tenacibaculum sp. SG-28 TaxID=754426 RepID=UPI000CF5498A|nr:T9SS type A sorting domain-containing protein [Tenacibaculum sp. SG-28]PQJ20629.1 hypothetical protein BSU00_09980 [Tenacibaculum sp. SG-28]
MKTTLLLIFMLLTNYLYSQTTHDLTWKNDGSSAGQEITIEQGDTVRWTWGSGTHNLRATSGAESFNSGFANGPGHVFSHTFTKLGSTNYVCDPHAGNMFGTVTVSATAGVAESDLLRFTMYPNPASDFINLQVADDFRNATVTIYDAIGRNMYHATLVAEEDRIPIGNLSAGMYILKVNSGDKIGTKQMVKY